MEIIHHIVENVNPLFGFVREVKSQRFSYDGLLAFLNLAGSEIVELSHKIEENYDSVKGMGYSFECKESGTEKYFTRINPFASLSLQILDVLAEGRDRNKKLFKELDGMRKDYVDFQTNLFARAYHDYEREGKDIPLLDISLRVQAYVDSITHTTIEEVD